MKRKIKTVYILAAAALTLFASCGLVQMDFETNRTVKQAQKRTDYICLNAAKMKQLILSDTTCYKVVDIYSPCCGPCIESFANAYPQFKKLNDSLPVKYIYVLDGTGALKYNDNAREKYNITGGKYYFRDTVSYFAARKGTKYNDYYLTNLTNYIFKNDSLPKVTQLLGLPTYYLVNKQGRLKKCVFIDTDGKQYIEPMDLRTIADKRLDELDFYTLDTVRIENNQMICTPAGCK
ncbi:MAG: hypothetical protein IJ250_05645 [Bacteroidales bacterium]|nr:hypothetical protein [Bacteroidales bacterium]